MRKTRFAVVFVAVLAMGISACGSTGSKSAKTTNSSNGGSTPAAGSSCGSKGKTPIKAAFIYVGSKADAGWTKAHDEGRLYVEKHLGSKVQTTFKENVPEGPQTAQVVNDLINDGNNIIFGTSFGFQDALVAAAKTHPDICFAQATGTVLGTNLSQYYGAGEEGTYLAGMTAGLSTKSNKIGYVAPLPIPETLRLADAYTLGARSVNPAATVQVIWTGSWFDPTKEKQAAEALVANGADVLAQGTDSPTTGSVAQEHNLKWNGYDSNQLSFAPNSWLTGAAYNWGPYYLKQITAAMNGTFKSSNYYGSLKDGFVQLSPFGSTVPQDVQQKVDAKKQEIINGTFHVLEGPIKDQSGKVVVPAGHVMTETERYNISWFVDGVIGNPNGGS